MSAAAAGVPPPGLATGPSAGTSDRGVAAAPRLDWIDGFRGLAVVLMIEAHVTNTFLAPALKQGAFFHGLNFFNGLVAPAFLLIAGYLQGLSTARPATPGKWRRYAGLAAAGYALHLPLGAILSGQGALALRVGSQVDVLQCLAVSLFLVFSIQRVFPAGGQRSAVASIEGNAPPLLPGTPQRRSVALQGCDAVLAGCAAVFIGGAACAQTFHQLPVPLLAFVNASTGSLFPLFPWAGFVLAGALAGRWRQHDLALTAGILVLARCIPAPEPFAAHSVDFFFERLGWVLLATSLCKRLSPRFQPRWLLVAGKRSLTMYLVHLILISLVAGAGVSTTANLALLVALYLAILAVTWLCAWGGPALKVMFLQRKRLL